MVNNDCFYLVRIDTFEQFARRVHILAVAQKASLQGREARVSSVELHLQRSGNRRNV